MGLAVGSGLYFLGISSTLLILLIELLVHRKGNMSHYTEAGHIEVNLTKKQYESGRSGKEDRRL